MIKAGFWKSVFMMYRCAGVNITEHMLSVFYDVCVCDRDCTTMRETKKSLYHSVPLFPSFI